ncbi:hypothetical protein AERO8C_150212 [Aeromonas veronii]|uniref:Uncharacterized protein n=1 Tax=Aeromonas veronii TaxID=654 RepID=A0A653KWI8_AERVE|nr:hypothetical protein AERO8C_150212 [Aeromonas veronii]
MNSPSARASPMPASVGPIPKCCCEIWRMPSQPVTPVKAILAALLIVNAPLELQRCRSAKSNP